MKADVLPFCSSKELWRTGTNFHLLCSEEIGHVQTVGRGASLDLTVS